MDNDWIEHVFTEYIPFCMIYPISQDAERPYESFPLSFAPRSLLRVRKRRFPFGEQCVVLKTWVTEASNQQTISELWVQSAKLFPAETSTSILSNAVVMRCRHRTQWWTLSARCLWHTMIGFLSSSHWIARSFWQMKRCMKPTSLPMSHVNDY